MHNKNEKRIEETRKKGRFTHTNARTHARTHARTAESQKRIHRTKSEYQIKVLLIRINRGKVVDETTKKNMRKHCLFRIFQWRKTNGPTGYRWHQWRIVKEAHEKKHRVWQKKIKININGWYRRVWGQMKTGCAVQFIIKLYHGRIWNDYTLRPRTTEYIVRTNDAHHIFGKHTQIHHHKTRLAY